MCKIYKIVDSICGKCTAEACAGANNEIHVQKIVLHYILSTKDCSTTYS